mmetsp:Transcript_52053/g.121016  ORF Transcript_52053/g.121016 Transcript_52053/m.121016 type:complete len:227 (+) Transcript_52053:185-865(+)|eukprot:CAMPEP_0171099242 /NCGR_PEP_ID=MMETSP0766_2-20121228/50894_1 /TAXON_ID=439317 /ORGANISM="Gambierdiscus australes, Strain CAWD 149" /LENGTH=226 /DNA_ID=CAMNT_0011558817 /DNA_START=162 /DNA_END=842 /DNA_ORIENTATION=-
MQDLGSNHRAWQQRLGRERTPGRYAVVVYSDQARGGTSRTSREATGARLHDSTSEPSLTPPRGGSATGTRQAARSAQQAWKEPGARKSRSQSRRGTPAPPRGSTSCSQGTTGSRDPQTGWLPKPATARTQTGNSYFKRSGELVLINNGIRRSVPPTPSLRSLRTGMTSASMDSALWREVEQVVQQEVAKFVKPLQDQLQSEAEARQRAEAALRSAGVSAEALVASA